MNCALLASRFSSQHRQLLLTRKTSAERTFAERIETDTFKRVQRLHSLSYLVRKNIDHFISRPTIITMSISYYGYPCPDLKRPYSKMADAKSTIDAHVGCNRVLYVTNGEEQLKYESVRGFVGTENCVALYRIICTCTVCTYTYNVETVWLSTGHCPNP